MKASGDDDRKPAARPTTKRPKLLDASATGEEIALNDADDVASSSVELNNLPGEIKTQFFAFLDVKTLCIAREVCREWKQNCKQAIENKKKDGAGVFTTNDELRQAVNDYYKCKYEEYDAELAEKLAREYGWVIGRWTVSAVTDFSRVFQNKFRFNDDIGDWNVGNGTTFAFMFVYCHVFNQDLSRWRMDKAVDLKFMFRGCSKFNKDLPWNTSNVQDIRAMFRGATSFNGDIKSWNTSSVINASGLFAYAEAFNGVISRFDMSNCTNMGHMFYNATSFNQDLSRWTVSNVESMYQMFYDATSFCQDLSAWDVSNVQHMNCIFMYSGVTREQFNSWEGWAARVQELENFQWER
jgi:surface protein